MSTKIPYPCIVAAKQGNPEAMERIIKHYRPYIITQSKRSFFDEYGNHYEFIDDSIRQRIEARLMHKIIFHFDLERVPEGLSIETTDIHPQ